MKCEIKDVSFKYDEINILKNINMIINSGEIISIIGPSGSGKTTLLKILAGILDDYTGNISFSSLDLQSNSRVIVFQDFLLFPHMSVYQNIAFGLKARKKPKTEISDKVTKYLKYFGLEDKKDVLPNELSSGQKQRVAIARAMIVEPQLLLLDEPFANLDYNLKLETAEFIKQTQKHFNITTVCVTHDQREAFYISDKIGVLLDGELLDFNNIKDIILKPKSLKCVQFLGHINYIPKISTMLFINELPFEDLYVKPFNIILYQDNQSDFYIKNINYSNELINYTITNNNLEVKVTSLEYRFNLGETVSMEIKDYLLKDTLC